MNIYKLLIVSILLTLSLVSLANAGEEMIKDGVTYVTNSDVPSKGIEILELKELWRIGGEDEEFIFDSNEQILHAKDNNLYILDGHSDLIYVLNLEGKLERVINFLPEIQRHGRERIIDMFLRDDEIALLSESPVKIICIDYFGTPRRTVNLPIIWSLVDHADCENGNLVMGGWSPIRREVFLSRFSIFGEVQKNYAFSETDSSPKEGDKWFSENIEYFWLSKPWDIASDGRMYFAPNWSTPEKGSYGIKVYGHDDELKMVVTRKFQAHKRSQKEKDLQGPLSFEGYDRFHDYLANGAEYFVEEFEQDIVQIFAHSDGNIWVRTSQSIRNQLPGIMITYDVFDPQGHFVRQVSLACDGNGEKDVVYFLNNDMIVIVKGRVGSRVYPEADILEIICYLIE